MVGEVHMLSPAQLGERHRRGAHRFLLEVVRVFGEGDPSLLERFEGNWLIAFKTALPALFKDPLLS